jgi:two-component system alkaline phosphatase synthesis response regulator PhoP
MPKILLIEDDPDIRKLLRYHLEKEGHAVTTAGDGEEGVALFRRDTPRLVLLDLMLPKVDGLEVCRLLRGEGPRVPILMLTAKSAEVDKIVGLEMGADDYVTKPFSLGELMTRVKALLRRTGEGEPESLHPVHTAGTLVLDVDRHEIHLGKKPVEVTGKEFELLRALWRARGKVLSREDILERVWGLDRAADIDTRTVDQHMARLRSKLGVERRRLRTVKGVGYRFVADP